MPEMRAKKKRLSEQPMISRHFMNILYMWLVFLLEIKNTETKGSQVRQHMVILKGDSHSCSSNILTLII